MTSMNRPEEAPPGTLVRGLMRAAGKVAIGTRLTKDDDSPYVSLALVASAHDGSPLLLLSTLADHTRNLDADPRISLLFDGTTGLVSPLTGARASVQGKAVRSDDPLLLDRFVRRHPDAAIYAGFADFGMFQVEVDKAHLVAGFGRIHWVDAEHILCDVGAAASLASEEAAIVEHMNADHADAVQLYARHAGEAGDGWLMTGVDPEGTDLLREGARLRVAFAKPVRDAQSARVELVRLIKQIRAGQDAPLA